MKNMFKIFILFIFGIILSGCSSSENITIENTGVTNEEFKIFADNQYYYFQEDPISEYINSQVDPYRSELEQAGYSYDTYTTMDNSGIEIKKIYNNICSYFNNSHFIKRLYGSVICNETENYYEIRSNTSLLYNGNESENYLLDNFDNVRFSLETELYIDDQNADEVDKNVYTWTFKRANLDKSFRLKILKHNLSNNIVKPKNSSKTSYVVIGIIVLLVLFISYVLYMKHKRRQIDY